MLAYAPPVVSPTGEGFDVFAERQFVQRMPEWAALAKEGASGKPLEAPGRYDVVFDGYTMASLVSTLGAALEADRALGYQANDVGTSYLAPLDKVLGTAPFPAALTVMADRTMAGGAAAVKWDAEGVETQAFPLIQRGQLVDYATGRETAVALTPWYQRQGQPIRSHGCAGAESALVAPLVQTPNLTVRPGAQDARVEELLAGIEHGYAFLEGGVWPDQQQLSVMGNASRVYEVRNGRLAGRVTQARFLARLPELWKSLVALGGPRSAVSCGFTSAKGQPQQSAAHTVHAPAARFKNIAVIGARR
jgi:TldD protein